jgi:hypothetical protein
MKSIRMKGVLGFINEDRDESRTKLVPRVFRID